MEDQKSNQPKQQQQSLESEFVENTSFHGINRIGDPDKPVWLRCLWVLAVGACLGTCSWQIVLRFQEYFSYNVNTQVEVIYQSPLPFPAVTICNFNRYVKNNRSIEVRKEIFKMGIILSD